MKLLVITPEQTGADEIPIANQLLAAGLQRLHIRKPSFSAADYEAYVAKIDRKYHSRLCIHGSFGLYRQLGLGGIHLSSYARSEQAVWSAIGDIPPAAISTSFHSWQEIERNTVLYGYVFISPVFHSISKAGYEAGIDLDRAIAVKHELVAAARHCPLIIGLGGVGEAEARLLQQRGFDGAALLGSVWLSEDPIASLATISAAVIQG